MFWPKFDNPCGPRTGFLLLWTPLPCKYSAYTASANGVVVSHLLTATTSRPPAHMKPPQPLRTLVPAVLRGPVDSMHVVGGSGGMRRECCIRAQSTAVGTTSWSNFCFHTENLVWRPGNSVCFRVRDLMYYTIASHCPVW